ncbi:hypothetical protein AB0K60_07485 [Thermopolyspora sp. NPDC052614]
MDGTVEVSAPGRARIGLDPYGRRRFRASAPGAAPADAASAERDRLG